MFRDPHYTESVKLHTVPDIDVKIHSSNRDYHLILTAVRTSIRF